MEQIILSTERLDICAFEETDAPFVLQLLNSAGWIQYIGDRNVHTIAAAVKYIRERFLQSYQTNGYGLYTMRLKSTGFTIGTCGLIKRPSLEHTDIGFAVLPEYMGKGYTSEAAAAVLHYGFKKLHLPTIVAITTPDNIASQRVLEKIGLRRDGEIIDPDTQEMLSTFKIDLKDYLNL